MTSARVVVITGASGEIGRALALRFAAGGASLVLVDRLKADCEPVAAIAIEAGAKDVMLLGANQTSVTEVNTAFDEIRERYGRIDTLVANAGFARFGSFLDISPKIWSLHVDINLSGTFFVCQAAAKIMVDSRQGGAIVVTSSCLGLSHSDMTGAYCATKAALLMLVRTMAAELGVHRIRANAVLPGVVDTGMTHEMLEQAGCRDQILNETPLGRFGAPSDVASAAHYLASADASFITGASLLVDGGQSIYGQPRWYGQDRRVPHESRWIPVWEK